MRRQRPRRFATAKFAAVLWCAVTYGSNGRKIYKSVDGGQSWINLTTPLLNGVRISNILAQYGTDGGIYLGTDAGVYPHGRNAEEFALLVSAGVRPIDALRAATSVDAALLGISDQVGTLTVGKLADVTVLTQDIMTIDEARIPETGVAYTIVGGEVVYTGAGR